MYLEPIFFPSYFILSLVFCGKRYTSFIAPHRSLTPSNFYSHELILFFLINIPFSLTVEHTIASFNTYKSRKKREKYLTFNSFSRPNNLLAQILFYCRSFYLSLPLSHFLSLTYHFFLWLSISPLLFICI